MKIILKPIKWVLKIVLILLIIPTILLFLIYKDNKPPQIEDDYLLTEVLTNSIDNLIDNNNADKKISLSITSNLINNEIKNVLENNLDFNYNNEYIYSYQNIKVLGVWTEFINDQLVFNFSVHIKTPVLIYKTNLKIIFIMEKVDNNNFEITFKIKKLDIGKLPIAWAASIAPSIIEFFTKSDIEEVVNSKFSFMKLNIKQKSLTINYNELINKENNETINLITELLIKNELFTYKIDQQLDLEIDLNNISNNNIKEDVNSFNSELEYETFLQLKGLESIINNNNKITFTEDEINKVITYNIIANSNLNILVEETIKDYQIIVLSPYLIFNNDNIYIHIPIKFGKDNNYFKTSINAQVTLTKSNNDLIINLNKKFLGNMDLTDDLLSYLINNINDDNITLSQIKLENFYTNLQQPLINFTNITLNNNMLEFNYEIE